MEKQKVNINYGQLMEMVYNCVKKVISESMNEIGDTPAGRETLSRAANKAYSLGRRGQGSNIAAGLHKAVADKFGEGAAYNKYKYTNSRGRSVSLYSTGEVLISDENGLHAHNYTLDDLFLKGMWNILKTEDLKTARRIAKWCSERLKDESMYERLCDWHTFADQ